MEYLSGLNAQQKEAVLHTEGPLLIVAGAGTGKTRVLTHRVLHLIKKGVLPESILAITFTNKAASEMRERVAKLLGTTIATEWPFFSANMPFVGTFHSLGVMILKQHAEAIGRTKHFSIFDRDDSLSLIKKIQKELGIDPKQFAPSALLSLISRAKGEALTPETFRETKAMDYTNRIVLAAWERYRDGLIKEKAFDFDDLLLATLELFKKHPQILESYRERFKYIHVDEYQDTNIVQYELIKMLAHPRNNICVVGDHDQCIYTWRSADLRNLQRFEEEFEGARVILLEENYRSTKTILSAANDAIKQNVFRKEKILYTNNKDGELIEVHGALDGSAEARFIVNRTKELLAGGTPAHEIAVLFRAHFLSRALEEAFLDAKVPYQVLGTRFFERKEIKDMISYIHAARNPDSPTHLSRVINVPARGIGKTTLLRVLANAEHELSASHKAKVDGFRSLLARIKQATETLTPSGVIAYILSESGLERELAGGNDDDHERLLNIKELASLAVRYDKLPENERLDAFLEAAALASDQDSLVREEASVKLMTIHAAKGLEFGHVFISGLEEGLFPDERSETRGTPEEREEERRLFYVALTRAKHQAHLSYASIRTIFGSANITVPSRFLNDIDPSLISFGNDFGRSNGDGPRELLTINLDDL
ncbi:MAG: UvrD-helicase domain-containing protein [Candidatus Pacebacteria bacterium]|nr:UvrD-helicase domain-containing protein [Candidatus Paceibacterota bacterium]